MAAFSRIPRSARLWACATAMLVAALVLAAPAGAITKKTVTKHYRVTGSTVPELRTSMARNSPTGHPGYAWGTITWQYNLRLDASGTRCSLVDVRVALKQTYTMPKWAKPEDVAQDVVDRWNTFMDALWKHERGHGTLSSKAAVGIERFLGSVSRSTCSAAKSAANAGAKSRIAKQQKQQVAYDKRTDHGATQGATL